MQLTVSVAVPAAIDDVFDFLDDPASMLTVGGHAAEHSQGIDLVGTQPDGRRTFDIRMRAGSREWVQSVEQVLRERPTRLVTRGWTWTENRNDPYLSVTTDRQLTSESGGTRVAMTVQYEPHKRSLLAFAVNWLQRDRTRIELEHQLHFLAEHFAARDFQQR